MYSFGGSVSSTRVGDLNSDNSQSDISTSDSTSDDISCTTPEGLQGQCISLNDCPSLLQVYFSRIVNSRQQSIVSICCVFRPANPCLCMHLHSQKQTEHPNSGLLIYVTMIKNNDLFHLTKHSPSLRLASCSNPHPSFSTACDVTSCRCHPYYSMYTNFFFSLLPR